MMGFLFSFATVTEEYENSEKYHCEQSTGFFGQLPLSSNLGPVSYEHCNLQQVL